MTHAVTTSDLLARTGGLLLAGGMSRRFGAEKAVALFRGRAMMDHVAERFVICAGYAVSARCGSAAAKRAGSLGIRVLLDDADMPSGALAGVCVGLTWARARGYDFLATAPCDTPNLPADLFAQLAVNLGNAPAAYATTAIGGHPLCAIWHIKLEHALRETLRLGVHPPAHAFLTACGAPPVFFDVLTGFANANTPEALAALEAMP